MEDKSEAMPPLPKPFMRHWINAPFEDVELFTFEQMHDYARAALAQRQQVPLPEFECASQYATKRGLAVSREWVRGWDACTDYIEELLKAHGIGKQEDK